MQIQTSYLFLPFHKKNCITYLALSKTITKNYANARRFEQPNQSIFDEFLKICII